MKLNIITFIITCLMITSGGFAQIDRSKQPEPGPAPKINLGQPETFNLDNGLKVLIVENHKLPRVSASLIIDNPPHSEGAKPATGSLVSALLGTGTENISKDEFNEEIDFLGASINFGAESASARSLSKFFPRVLELMAEGALNPEFTQEEFQTEQTKLIEGLKSSDNAVGAIASRVSSALAYGKDHPFGEFPTPENTENVALQDVQNYYNKYFVPANAYLVVVGDVRTSEVKELVKKNFGKWKAATPPSQELPEVRNAEEIQVNFVDMPNAVQSELRLQNTIDLQMANKDYFPVIVANQILGGSFGSYLNMNLREKHGFTYGAGSSTGASKYASRFIVSTSVRNAVTDSAVVQALKEIDRIKTEPVDEEMLQNAKNEFAGNFVMRLEQPSTIANYALGIKINDLPEDFYQTYLQKLEAVTAEDVQRVAKKYFQTDNMRIVIAGKGSEVADKLENLNYKGKDIPVKYFDKKATEVKKPDYNKQLDPNMTVKAVFDKYIDAIGGQEAVADINSVYTIAEADVQGQKLNLETKTTTKGQTNQSIKMGGNIVQKQVFNGEEGFVMAGGQKIPFNEEQVTAARAEANPFPETIAAEAKLEGIEAVNGDDAYVVAMNETTKNYYDVDSGLKVQSIKTVTQGPQTMTIPTLYSDYKEVNGVKFPYTISQSMGPQSFQFNVTEIKVNEGVTDADFQ